MKESELPRVAIVAPNMSFNMGGEAARPIHYARHLVSRGYPIRLLTHARCRREFTERHTDLVDVATFVDDTALHKMIWTLTKWMPDRVRQFLGGQLLDLLTDRAISRRLRELDGQIDLVHQPVPISPRILRAIRTDRPLVIGPLNGDIGYPPALAGRESRLVRSFVRFGRRVAPALHKLLPSRPILLIVSNKRTEEALPFRIEPARIRHLRANAVDLALWNRVRDHAAREPGARVRIATMSRLTRFKCVDLLIEAFATSEALRRDAELVVIGDGEEKAALEGLARTLGVADQVHFLGWMAHERAVEELLRCDLFAFPSLQDPGGAVVMEAACLGLPVVCADWGGPGEYLPEGGGVAVGVQSDRGYVDGIRRALEELTADGELRAGMGARARQAAEASFSWAHRIDALEQIYREAIQSKGPVSAQHGRAPAAGGA